MPILVNGIDQAYGTEPENPGQETVGGYAYKYILSSTVAYNEDIDAVISRYSVYPQQWIEHQENFIHLNLEYLGCLMILKVN